MKIRRRSDGEMQRRILLGLLTSRHFLKASLSALDISLLKDGAFKTIATWCIEYFKQYGRAPRKDIEPIYYAWLARGDNEGSPQAEMIEDLLQKLSQEYSNKDGKINDAYLLDELTQYMTRLRLDRLQIAIEDGLSRGDLAGAVSEIHRFRQTSTSREAGIDVLGDVNAFDIAFRDPVEPLFTFPGAAGKFLNHALVREGLIGIEAPEKRGKSFWCIELAVRAIAARRRVAFFGTGDLSASQMMLRIGVRISGKPVYESQCGTIQVPEKIIAPMEMVYREVVKEFPVQPSTCRKAADRWVRSKGLSTGPPYLMLSCHPTCTLTVAGIDAILTGWELERVFVPDVIIIDYADILKPPDERKQARDQVNDIWMAMRRLSQERRCLVITPTQANARAYEADRLSLRTVSEDKRKHAHVTGMLALNQREDEKKIGMMRLSWLLLREYPFSPNEFLYVGQCPQLARFCTCSALASEIRQGEDNEYENENENQGRIGRRR